VRLKKIEYHAAHSPLFSEESILEVSCRSGIRHLLSRMGEVMALLWAREGERRGSRVIEIGRLLGYQTGEGE
jgi:hypothetical protein